MTKSANIATNQCRTMSKNVAKMSHFFDLYLTVYKGLSLFSVAVLFSLKKKKKKINKKGI